MSRFFNIRIIDSIMVVERKTFPRIRIFVKIEKTIPEVARITLLEECSGAEVARVIRMINYFLNHFTKEEIAAYR